MYLLVLYCSLLAADPLEEKKVEAGNVAAPKLTFNAAFSVMDAAFITTAAKTKTMLPVHQGIVVRGVEPNGTAATAGLKPTDIIVSIDGQSVRSADEYKKILEKLTADKPVAFEVWGLAPKVVRNQTRYSYQKKTVQIAPVVAPAPTAPAATAPAEVAAAAAKPGESNPGEVKLGDAKTVEVKKFEGACPLLIDQTYVFHNPHNNERQIYLRVHARHETITSFELYADCFDQAGQSIGSVGGEDNRDAGRCKRSISSNAVSEVFLTLPGMQATTKAKIEIRRIELQGGAVWTPGKGNATVITAGPQR